MPRTLAAAMVIALLGVVTGCGSSGSSGADAETGTEQTEAVKQVAEESEAAEAKAPKGASPALRAIYGSFQPPDTTGMEPAAAKAVKAGEKACRGKTPTEVKEEFYPEAEEFLEPDQARMIKQIGDYEKQAKSDRSFVAGQLAADTYAATLPSATEAAGYQGCVYALAQELEHKLEPNKKQKK